MQGVNFYSICSSKVPSATPYSSSLCISPEKLLNPPEQL
jgi:hypothetical protein